MATTSSGIHAPVGRLAEEVRHGLLHQRHAGLPADEHHVIDVVRRQAGILTHCSTLFMV